MLPTPAEVMRKLDAFITEVGMQALKSGAYVLRVTTKRNTDSVCVCCGGDQLSFV